MSGEQILLVEDSNAVAMGLIYALEQQGFIPSRADTAAVAREMLAANVFDLIILDIRLPDGSGFDLCRQLRSEGSRVPIIMLTARDETSDKIIGLEMGADDYLTKPFELQELVARIRACLRRCSGDLAPVMAEKLSIGDLTLDLRTQRAFRHQQEIHLTPTEFRILVFLTQNADRIVDRTSIFQHLWGENYLSGDPRSIDVHIRNLRRKIEADPSNPRLIVTVRGAGYRCGWH